MRKSLFANTLLVITFVSLHLRYGTHLPTGFSKIDEWLLNPTDRPDFSVKSEAIEYVKNAIKKSGTPSRVIGEGHVLFSGYNSRYGLESIVPVEPVRSGRYLELLYVLEYPNPWWKTSSQRSLVPRTGYMQSHAFGLDLLGVGYVVSHVGTTVPRNMELVHSSDLDVWQRSSVWPRAFFVNSFIEIRNPTDFSRVVMDKADTPFAAVESQYIPLKFSQYANANSRAVPATEYELTNNTTRFTVEATGPGIIVLGETYYPGNFVVTLNGVNVEYFPVNGAFKGIWVEHPGIYHVSFSYRPERLGQAMFMALFGLALLFVVTSCATRWRNKDRKQMALYDLF